MQQSLIGGNGGDLLNNAATEYNTLVGRVAWNATEDNQKQMIASTGKLRYLMVWQDGDEGGAGKQWIYTVMKNGAPTALVVTLTNLETQGTSGAIEIDVAPGDVVSLRATSVNAPTNRRACWSCQFKGSVASNGGLFMVHSSCAGAGPHYYVPHGATGPGTEYTWRCPISGTISNMYVWLSVSPGVAPDAYVFTLRKNGVDTALTVTITAPATTGSDTVNSVAFNAGDTISIKVQGLNVPANNPQVALGLKMIPTTNGESIAAFQSAGSLSVTNTYHNVSAASSTWLAAALEYACYQLTSATELRNLYVDLSVAPGAGTSWQFHIRDNLVNTALTTTIANLATSNNDVVNRVAVANGHVVTIGATEVGATVSPSVYFSFGQYITPPVEPKGGSNIAAKMVAAGIL